jgi:hypothetical protein
MFPGQASRHDSTAQHSTAQHSRRVHDTHTYRHRLHAPRGGALPPLLGGSDGFGCALHSLLCCCHKGIQFLWGMAEQQQKAVPRAAMPPYQRLHGEGMAGDAIR